MQILTESQRATIERSMPLMVLGGVCLLAMSVFLQLLICIALFASWPKAPDPAPAPAVVAAAPATKKAQTTSGILGSSRNPFHVIVDNEVDVEVKNRSSIDVKVHDHYILSGDPIPVRVVD